jgi:hypothetical protein
LEKEAVKEQEVHNMPVLYDKSIEYEKKCQKKTISKLQEQADKIQEELTKLNNQIKNIK